MLVFYRAPIPGYALSRLLIPIPCSILLCLCVLRAFLYVKSDFHDLWEQF